MNNKKRGNGYSLTRREFLGRLAGLLIAGELLCFDEGKTTSTDTFRGGIKPKEVASGDFTKEALYYQKLAKNIIRCQLCPNQCTLTPGSRGICGVRENSKGTLYTLVYSRVCALHNDPIEKKPLFHYHPGISALSLATPGCNFTCKYCQNWEISQSLPEEVDCFYLPPEGLIKLAKKYKAKALAFTYSEPVIFYEYMYECATLGKKAGIPGIMISNGFIEEKPLKELCKQLGAVKIDFKGFSEEFYTNICSGRLLPVLNTLENLKKIGIWFEIVILILPTLNDNPQEIKKMCEWIKNNLGVDVPVHFSRFFPAYKLQNLSATPIDTLEQLRKIAQDVGLHYVYIGNVPGHIGENTYCPKCKKEIISRVGYKILNLNILKGKCKYCGYPIAGVWD